MRSGARRVTVLDASAAVNVLLGRTTEPDLSGLVVRGVAAPHHIDVEITSALRGQVLGGKLAEGVALNRLGAFLAWPVERVPLRGLAPRIWELRHAMSAYDAAYVALAEVTGRPLVTCDAKLLSGGHRAEVRVVA